MNEISSCSSCCGLNNLKLTKAQKDHWLIENTTKFLKTDVGQAQNIVEFRKQGEDFLYDYIINHDTYVCPFIGYVATNPARTGCMLHPLAGIHKQVSQWEHPQNFSFYGESICQTFDCYSKENNLLENVKIDNLDSIIYGQITANQNLIRLIGIMCEQQRSQKSKLFEIIIEFLENNQSSITGFEGFIDWTKQDVNLWHAVGTLLSQEEVDYNPFNITKAGIEIGDKLRELSNK